VSEMAMARVLTVLVLLAAVPACRHPRGASQREWVRWFDETTHNLTRWNVGDLSAPQGDVIQTFDQLSLRLSRDWRRRNDNGCWDKDTERWPTGGWRDICVSRIVPEDHLRPTFFLRPRPPIPNMADQHQSEDWEVGVITIGDRRAIVERARVSGGIEGAKRERRTSILLELQSGTWAQVDGRMGDDLGFAEIVSIAATIQPS